MRKGHVGCLLVCSGKRLIGIFTERDLMRRVLAAGKPLTVPVSECMTPNPVTVHPKEPTGLLFAAWKKGATATCR